MKQLSVMVSRVGDYKAAADAAAMSNNSEEDDNKNNNSTTELRPVVTAIAKNISDLTKVVSKASNLPTFLKFIPPPPPPKDEPTTTGFVRPPSKPEDQAGPMAHLIISCAATLPLQTPCYAALTLSVHAYSHNSGITEYTGFASRCVTYAMQRLSQDMDTLFLVSASHVSEARPKIACRIKLMLRYLALLGKLQVIQGHETTDNSAGDNDDSGKWSLLGFLQTLVEAALAAAPTDDAFAAANSNNAAASLVLVYFVLSTIPYLLSFIPADVIQEHLLDPLQTLLSTYASTFAPGIGMTAILLKEEQAEGGNDDEDDDDEDDEEEISEVVCDSLQDLYRSVQLMMKQQQGENTNTTTTSRFALLTDAPWMGIPGPPPAAPAPTENSEMDTGVKTEEGIKAEDTAAADAAPMEEAGPLTNPVAPMRLPAPEGGFKSLALLNISSTSDNNEESEDTMGVAEVAKPQIQPFPLEVVVFGRLPIFGSPQAPKAEGDTATDEEDMDDEDAPANEQVAAYSKGYGILDRCLMADSIRDLLCCHESSVSGIGQEKGSAKSVAEQIWSIGQALSPPSNPDESSASVSSSAACPGGLEYAILEAMLSLILQSSSNSTFRQIFLSRVLLELTRLQPTLVSPALALAMSNLVQDYLPALVPTARRNLSSWLSFHLANTDYQWPAAYWSHWQSFADTDEKRIQSRGVFVTTTLSFLKENVNNPGVLVKDCLPKECQELVNQIVAPLPAAVAADDTLASVEKEVRRRIWDDDEHPESLQGHVTGDELSETLASVGLDSSSMQRVWCRSGIVLKGLLQPLEREHERLLAALTEAKEKKLHENGDGEDDSAMEEDDDLSADSLAVTLEILTRYGPVLAGAIAKDKENLQQSLQGSEGEHSMLSTCEPHLLDILQAKTVFSRAIFEGCLDCLIHQADIFNCMGVIRWALGDVPGGDGQAQESAKVVERWYEFANDAIRVELVNAITTALAGGEDGGMVIDRTGEGSMEAEPETAQDGNTILAAMERVSPLLDYIVRRTCTLLVAQTDESQQGTKLTAVQVDLVEGVKTCLRSTHGLFFSLMRKSNENEKGVPEHEIKECLAQSALTGSKLAGVCEEFSDGNAVNADRKSVV